MTLTLPVLAGFLDLHALLHGWGGQALLGIALIVFVESGLLFPFLPGDSLLFTAGMLHVALGLHLGVLVAVVAAAGAVGGFVGHAIGRRYGRRLFTPDARILRSDHLVRTEGFFARHGGLSVALGRFVPVVRTFIPVISGTVRQPLGAFAVWNVLGALTWAAALIVAGAQLGHIAWIADNIDLITVGIIVASLAPFAVHLIRSSRRSVVAEVAPPQA